MCYVDGAVTRWQGDTVTLSGCQITEGGEQMALVEGCSQEIRIATYKCNASLVDQVGLPIDVLTVRVRVPGDYQFMAACGVKYKFEEGVCNKGKIYAVRSVPPNLKIARSIGI